MMENKNGIQPLKYNRSQSISIQIKKLDQNNLFFLFTNLSGYISHLNITLITPSKYFEKYIEISEGLTQELKALKAMARSSFTLSRLYYLAYTESRSLSRIYMLSLIGSLFTLDNKLDQPIAQQHEDLARLIRELLFFLSKTVSHLPAFFARYFAFSFLKEHFSKINSSLAVTFLLSNLIEMNTLLRTIGKDYPNSKEETKVLTCLIEQNINLLFSLKDMTSEMYRVHILSSLISLVYHAEDNSYQEYIIDWIISGLFEEYIIISLEPLLSILLPLYHEIDPNIHKKVKRILDRLLSYFKNNLDPKMIIDNLNNRYTDIFEYLHTILSKARLLIEIKPFIELVESYVHFTIYASPREHKAKILNRIFYELEGYCNDYQQSVRYFSQDVMVIYERICGCIFRSDVKIFDVGVLTYFTKYFDKGNVLRSSCNVLKNIVRYKTEINSPEKMSFIVEIIQKVLNNRKSDDGNEQQLIIQILGLIHNPDPEKQLQMFMIMKNIYDSKHAQLTKLSLPSFYHTLLQLVNKCEVGYLKRKNSIDCSVEAFNGPDLSEYNEEKLVVFLNIILTFIKDSFTSTFVCFAETNLNFIPNIIHQIDKIQVGREKFGDVCCSFVGTFLTLLIKNITDNAIKLKYMQELIETVSTLTIIPKQKYEKVVYAISQAAKGFQKRNDTTVLSILICSLYDNAVLTDQSKILALIEFAKREAEFCLVKIENLSLFVLILNKLLFYIDRGETFISVEFTNSVIKIISQNVDMLIKECPEIGKKIESEFTRIKEHIAKMKEKNKIELYKEIIS